MMRRGVTIGWYKRMRMIDVAKKYSRNTTWHVGNMGSAAKKEKRRWQPAPPINALGAENTPGANSTLGAKITPGAKKKGAKVQKGC